MESLAAGVFVGREEEVERLRNALEETFEGRGRLMMLVGEPGIGKTRTAQELGTYARVRGARVLVGRSYEGEGAPAYWPWLQMARAYIHDADPDTLVSDMGPGASDIAQVMSDAAGPDPRPAQARHRSRSSPSRRASASSTASRPSSRTPRSGQPLVLFLDDLHWADGPSLRLLQFLARELSDSRLLVIGTYRDVALGRKHPLSQALADLTREGLVERVPLHGLTEAEVERFIEVTASIHPPRCAGARGVRGDRGQPVLRQRDREPDGVGGDARRRQPARPLHGDDPAGRARGGGPPPRPAVRGLQPRAGGGLGGRARVRRRGGGARRRAAARPRARAARGGRGAAHRRRTRAGPAR